jgi:hypothetical protein
MWKMFCLLHMEYQIVVSLFHYVKEFHSKIKNLVMKKLVEF